MGAVTDLLTLPVSGVEVSDAPRRARRRLPRPTTLHWWAIGAGTAWVAGVVALAYAVRY